MNKIDLNNRKAVITRGAQGIGLAIAERLLDSGASVSLWNFYEYLLKDTSDTLSSKVKIKPVVIDVTDLDPVMNATKTIKELLGSIEILVCNAGISGPTTKIWEYPPEE